MPNATQRQMIRGNPKTEGPARGIPLPGFIMILFFSLILDVADLSEAIPAVGTAFVFIFGGVFGTFNWILYWTFGARGIRNIAIMATGFLIEQVPGLGVLPLNTVIAVVVFILGSAEVERLVSKGVEVAARVPLPQAKAVATAAKAAKVAEASRVA